MTAADLHKLVQGIEECVPKEMLYISDSVWCYDDGAEGWAALEPLHASDLIAGQVKRLMTDGYKTGVVSDGFFARHIDGDNHYAPTELEALLAAYRAWKGKEKAG